MLNRFNGGANQSKNNMRDFDFSQSLRCFKDFWVGYILINWIVKEFKRFYKTSVLLNLFRDFTGFMRLSGMFSVFEDFSGFILKIAVNFGVGEHFWGFLTVSRGYFWNDMPPGFSTQAVYLQK